MEFTGERYIPELDGGIELEHMHRYLIATQIVKDKVILDIACGEGYGSFLLSSYAKDVVGVDISLDTVVHASNKYRAKNLKFIQGSCDSIPLGDHSIDIIVSFETIEHHDKHQEMMAEIKRVLKPDGILLISSPDKQNYSIRRNYQNPFHVLELTEFDFKNLVGRHFKNCKYYGQKVLTGSVILSENDSNQFVTYRSNGDEYNQIDGVSTPLYWLACATNGDLPKLITGVYESNGVEIFEQQEQHLNQKIEELLGYLKHRDMLILEHERHISDLKQQELRLNQKIEELLGYSNQRNYSFRMLVKLFIQKLLSIFKSAKDTNE